MISGVLPVVDDEMMAEYHRLTTDLGVRGLLIFSNIEGLPLDDDSMWRSMPRRPGTMCRSGSIRSTATPTPG